MNSLLIVLLFSIVIKKGVTFIGKSYSSFEKIVNKLSKYSSIVESVLDKKGSELRKLVSKTL